MYIARYEVAPFYVYIYNIGDILLQLLIDE